MYLPMLYTTVSFLKYDENGKFGSLAKQLESQGHGIDTN
jgi:hypothetical protein